MKRKTLKFLDRQNNSKNGIKDILTSKVLIISSIIVVAAIVLGSLYLWYVRTYGGARKITLYEEPKIDYEWLQITSEQGITGDYLWSRTNNLMVDGSDNGVLIPSWYMIEGRLNNESAEESGEYKLSDQALLLKIYVKQNDRKEAKKLKSKVNDNIDFESAAVDEQMMWLEAYLEYYSAYGTAKDLHRIEKMVDILFDENGLIKPVALKYASYGDGQFGSLDQVDDITNSENEGFVDFTGVPLLAIRLRLINSLEMNDFIPEGSYEANLKIVKDGLVSGDIPLYAYAYQLEADGTISYVYAHNHPATISVKDSIVTMRNLAEVNQLDSVPYVWLKNYLMNGNMIREDYYITTGNVDGDVVYDAYLDIMKIAFMKEDRDLYASASYFEAMRVASYTNSPALSMVYRERGDRYVFYACENLGLILALM